MFILKLRLFIDDTEKETAKNKKQTLDSFLTSRYTGVIVQLGHNERENMYRIFIDIPIDAPNVEEAITKGKEIMDLFLDEDKFTTDIAKLGISRLNYRLGDDEDRTPKNYFIINEQGHAASKKIKVDLVEVLDIDQD